MVEAECYCLMSKWVGYIDGDGNSAFDHHGFWYER